MCRESGVTMRDDLVGGGTIYRASRGAGWEKGDEGEGTCNSTVDLLLLRCL